MNLVDHHLNVKAFAPEQQLTYQIVRRLQVAAQIHSFPHLSSRSSLLVIVPSIRVAMAAARSLQHRRKLREQGILWSSR